MAFQLGGVLGFIGDAALIASLIRLLASHLAPRQMLLAPLVSWTAWSLPQLLPSAGLYEILPNSQFGLALVSAGMFSLAPIGFRLAESRQTETTHSSLQPSVLIRLFLILLASGAIYSLLGSLALVWNPNALQPTEDTRRALALSLATSLPSILLLALLVWRAPDRLGLALRCACVAVLAIVWIAVFLPPARALTYYGGVGMTSLVSTLSMYIGVRSSPSGVRLPIAVGLTLTFSLAATLASVSYRFSPLQLNGALLAATVLLMALILIPASARVPESQQGEEPADLHPNG